MNQGIRGTFGSLVAVVAKSATAEFDRRIGVADGVCAAAAVAANAATCDHA